ncbi:MAG: hypothetical protein ACYTEZ_05225 [Planctomycetota bacterium]
MSFTGVIGQDRAVATLRAHLGRTGGAGSTLVVGPEGVGRFLLAHRAARAILGAEALVDAMRHPDLNVLDAETGIDGVRAAAAALQRRPAQAPRQVLIVRDADRMSVEAHNALLKTLEEPPAGAAIFVVATDPALLPETVVSRCRLVRAGALTDEQTAEVLVGLGAPPAAARDAEGSPGRALFHQAAGVEAEADRLVVLLAEPHPDALAEAEGIARRRRDEESAEHRRRLVEVLRVVAVRLRRRLPASENALRAVLDGLRSLAANANGAIVLADLALYPWKKQQAGS